MIIEGVSLRELADCLGLDYRPNGKMRCPFCAREGDKGVLKLTFELDVFNCRKCNTGGGVLALYAKYQLGYKDLPTDKRELGKLSEEVMKFCRRDPIKREKANPIRVVPARQSVALMEPAPDEFLDKAYQAMSQIPQLQLTGNHREVLRKRGLTDQQIDRNGYRSISVMRSVPEEISSLYESCGGERERMRLRKVLQGEHIPPRDQILTGLYIAQYLQRQGISLKRIPGFFLFGEPGKNQSWCLNFPEGILIPTRNPLGQIVLWQVRTQNPKRKYQTVSCSKYPGAVNYKISRCHFPLGNAPLQEGTKLILTEGALKADIALALSGERNIAFAAILGVGNTSDLVEKLPGIRTQGIRTVYDGFDMDRLTNPFVNRETNKLFASIHQLDIGVEHLYWGEQCARRKLLFFKAFALNYGISYTVPEGASVYESLKTVAEAVFHFEIDSDTHKMLNPFEYDPGGNRDKIHFYWDPETKGIDDYLFSRSNSG